MSTLGVITVIGVVALVVLGWFLYRRFAQDKIDDLLKKRKADSKIAVPADFIEANEKIPVALALTADALYYENADLEARLDLNQIEEVEYGNDLLTGREIPHGRVLRLRSHGHSFEFVLDKINGEKFESLLPQHRADEPGRVHVNG